MKISLETHLYAPEMNKVFLNGIEFKPSKDQSMLSHGLVKISDVRKKFFKPVRSGKHVVITQFNDDHESLNNVVVLKGYFENYRHLIDTFKKYRKMKCRGINGYSYKYKFSIIGNGENPFFSNS
jgi:hypothetical protein